MLTVQVTRDELHFGASLTVRFLRGKPGRSHESKAVFRPDSDSYPIHRVDEFRGRVPEAWSGVVVPFGPHELMRIAFSGRWWKPNAVKVGVCGRNLVTGRPWREHLSAEPQNYLVCPDQHCRDDFAISMDSLGMGTATLDSDWSVGSTSSKQHWFAKLRLVVYEPRPGRFPDRPPRKSRRPEPKLSGEESARKPDSIDEGGEPYGPRPDPYGISTWDPRHCHSIDVYLVEWSRLESSDKL